MNTTLTMNAKEQKLSLMVDLKNGRLGKTLSAAEAENVVLHLEEMFQEAGREVFKEWLLGFESDADVLVVDGKPYRFKMVAEKEFLTKFGPIAIPRRLYPQDNGGPVHVPLDEAWNRHGRFAAVDVRESLLFLSAHLSPGEVVECLDNVAAFSCRKTTVQNIVDERGDSLGDHEDELMEMPEDKFPTFRKKREAEIRQATDRMPPDIVKILLNDGGTNLWAYADAEPLYDDFEKIVDFHHVGEHLSSGAEGKVGYRKMEGTLLSYTDGAERVIRSWEYYLNGYEHKESSQKLIEGCLTFMRNNVPRRESKRFRDNGWPIGSGPVEGACKNIVKKRMCPSGQRGSLRGGQAVLSLRAIVKYNRWSIFGNAYKQHIPSPRLTQST